MEMDGFGELGLSMEATPQELGFNGFQVVSGSWTWTPCTRENCRIGTVLTNLDPFNVHAIFWIFACGFEIRVPEQAPEPQQGVAQRYLEMDENVPRQTKARECKKKDEEKFVRLTITTERHFALIESHNSGRLLKSYLKNIFKITVLLFFQNLLRSFYQKVYHAFQNGIIGRGLPTHKVSHLTKPTSKTTCTNRNGPKAIQDQVLVSRVNLTRVPNSFATREPGQPSVRRRGMTTTSHTDPDASLSLLRRIGDTSITRVVKDL
ncbi:hypothetical protein LXL04_031580 [Taraxacum kok-saghyz]